MSSHPPEHEHPEVPKDIHPEIPESHEDPIFRKWWVGGWLSPIFVAAGTLIWCLLIYFLIKDRPRDWQYGVVPYIPAESAITSKTGPAGPSPKQVQLPKRSQEGKNEKR
ncbi:MAG: hypothetical protein Q7N50_07985 [Armatimonadota bacterium]|nr:hypothetical protein [Armatimonadota bacterium]